MGWEGTGHRKGAALGHWDRKGHGEGTLWDGTYWGVRGHNGVGGDRGRERLEAIGDPWQLFRVIRSHLGPLGATGGRLEPFGVNLGLFGVY